MSRQSIGVVGRVARANYHDYDIAAGDADEASHADMPRLRTVSRHFALEPGFI